MTQYNTPGTATQPGPTADSIPDHRPPAPKIEEIPPQQPSENEPEDATLSDDVSHEPEDTTASDDVSHVIVYHDDVSRDSRLEAEPGSTDSSESESEIGEDGDNKLYSECLGVD